MDTPGPHQRHGPESGDGRTDRRSFLTRAAVGAGAAWTAPVVISRTAAAAATDPQPSLPSSSSSSSSSVPPPAPRPLLEGPAASSPARKIVIVMMENRSFDHWLGWLAADAGYLDAGRVRYGAGFSVDGNVNQTFPGPSGSTATRPMLEQLAAENPYRGCGHPDPGHGWNAGRAQRDGGFLAPGSGNDFFALGYYRGEDLPITAQLARRFTVCDRSFASVLGPTYPNREYLLSGQSGGNKTNALPPSTGFTWDTIYDRLAAAGVSVRSYYTDLPVVALFGSRMGAYAHKIDDFFTDCAAGTLPSVSFVDPGFLGGSRTDNHPHGDIRAGERFVRDVFAAFARSSHWSEGVFVLTYDEWGGFFDHVAPPILADDRASPVDADNFGQAGFRVPTVVASPFSQRGFVDHRVYDHTSVLRFLEWRFLGAPPEGSGGSGWFLTTRDRNANNIGGSLVDRPDLDVGIDLDVAIGASSADCPGGVTSLAYEPGDKHSLEEAYDAGFFEMVGLDTEPSPMARDWVSV